jgi:serine/threonine protein kinase
MKLAGFYTLKRRLESDTTGPVWLANDEQSGKDVAVHFMPDAIAADAPAIEELRQEVKRNRQLIHPHILRIHDFIKEPNCVAICTDVVEGDTLAALKLKKNKGFFEVSEIRKWMTQLCQTIEDAHKANLLHRDITPANLIINRAGELVITNFGISRCIMDAMSRLRPQFRFDAALAHMSPQQLDAERPAKWDDIYSIGALIYELLTSKTPFYTGDIVPQIRKQVPPPMGHRRTELGIAGEPIPMHWEKLVASCLSKHTEQRPKSAAAVATILNVDRLEPSAHEAQAPAAKSAQKPEPKQSAPAPKPAQAAKKPAAEELEKPLVSPFTPLGPIFEMPGAEKEKAGFPAWGVAAAVLLIAIGAAGYYYYGFSGSNPTTEETTSVVAKSAPVQTPPLQPPPAPPKPAQVAVVSKPAPSAEKTQPVAAKTQPAPALVAAATAPPAKQAQTPEVNAADKNQPSFFSKASQSIAAALSSKPVQEPAKEQPAAAPEDSSPLGKATHLAAEKSRQLEQIKAAALVATQAQQEKAKRQQDAQAAAQAAQKAADDKVRAVTAAKQAAADKENQRKQREENQHKAEAELAAAQQAVADKTRLLEEARKSVVEADNQLKEQQNLQARGETEAQELQKAALEKQRFAAEAALAAAQAEAARKTQVDALQAAEKETTQAQLAAQKVRAAEEARKAAEEAGKIRLAMEKERERLEQEALEAQRAAEEKMRLAQQARKAAEQAETVLKQRGLASQQAEAEMKALPGQPTEELAMNVAKPAATPSPSPAASVSKVSATPTATPVTPKVQQRIENSLENSMGMKFAPVGDQLVCVWQTRIKDFEVFAKATGLKQNAWRQPGFKQGPDHPVVNVSWNDAMAFCKWLTEKEQREGLLSPSQYYRLPTDIEWSKAVGLPEEAGASAEERDMDVPNVYPWGTQWPPPKGAGNYTGEETASDVAIKGYDDGYQWTSPVGSFAPNKFGLYDMGGNVWQWVMDWWNSDHKHKVLRGGSWYNGALKLSLLSSCRVHAAPDSSTDNYGFRCVIASEAAKKSN